MASPWPYLSPTRSPLIVKLLLNAITSPSVRTGAPAGSLARYEFRSRLNPKRNRGAVRRNRQAAAAGEVEQLLLRRYLVEVLHDRAFGSQDRNGVVHDLLLLDAEDDAMEAVGPIAEMRDRDTRAAKRVPLQESRVIPEAVARREARGGGGVLGIEPGQDSEKLGGVGHGARHRSGRILIGGNRHDPRPAHQAHRRLDADEEVLGCRAQDRSRGLGADPHGGEVRGHGDARAGAGAAGRQRRAAVVERLPRIGARIERVEAVTGARQVAAALEQLLAQLRAVAGRHAGGADEVGELGEGPLPEDDRAGA